MSTRWDAILWDYWLFYPQYFWWSDTVAQRRVQVHTSLGLDQLCGRLFLAVVLYEFHMSWPTTFRMTSCLKTGWTWWRVRSLCCLLASWPTALCSVLSQCLEGVKHARTLSHTHTHTHTHTYSYFSVAWIVFGFCLRSHGSMAQTSRGSLTTVFARHCNS